MDYYWKTKEWIQKEKEIKENTMSITIFEPEVSYLRKDLIEFYKLLSETSEKEWKDEFISSEITRLNNKY